jgi:hypothetical protein
MSGDSSVNFPIDAVSAGEILDEPGIASNRAGIRVDLGASPATAPVEMTTLISTTITVPAAGYLVVRGGGTLEASGTSKRNQAYMQIDDTPGGGLIAPYFVIAGGGDFDQPAREHYWNMNAERIFVATGAGQYEFYLEAQPHPDNDVDAVTGILNPQLTISYYPSSYGPISAPVASAEALRFDVATPVGLSRTGTAQSTDTETYYQVDLRELELRALRARAEAERVERLLLEAQRLQQELTSVSATGR